MFFYVCILQLLWMCNVPVRERLRWTATTGAERGTVVIVVCLEPVSTAWLLQGKTLCKDAVVRASGAVCVLCSDDEHLAIDGAHAECSNSGAVAAIVFVTVDIERT
eukprot:m.225011 g.225011  ORF g.225011 m.225011 type:complete len:106 (-) comp10833_c1_seq8:408-725(-)